jgi:hypothetical protein
MEKYIYGFKLDNSESLVSYQKNMAFHFNPSYIKIDVRSYTTNFWLKAKDKK